MAFRRVVLNPNKVPKRFWAMACHGHSLICLDSKSFPIQSKVRRLPGFSSSSCKPVGQVSDRNSKKSEPRLRKVGIRKRNNVGSLLKMTKVNHDGWLMMVVLLHLQKLPKLLCPTGPPNLEMIQSLATTPNKRPTASPCHKGSVDESPWTSALPSSFSSVSSHRSGGFNQQPQPKEFGLGFFGKHFQMINNNQMKLFFKTVCFFAIACSLVLTFSANVKL